VCVCGKFDSCMSTFETSALPSDEYQGRIEEEVKDLDFYVPPEAIERDIADLPTKQELSEEPS
jgi:hypothetical protein